MEFFEALNPCSDEPAIERIALAARPTTLNGLRVCLIQTMPPGSGLEPVVEALRAATLDAYPTAEVTHFMRSNFMMTDMAEITHVATNFDVAVLVSGPAATMVHLAVIFANELEDRGIPAPLVHFDALAASAHHSVGSVGAPIRTFAFPAHTTAETPVAAARVVASLTLPATAEEQLTGIRIPPNRPRIACSGTLAEVLDFFHAQGWTDGLPIVPPTEANLAEMLAGTTRRPDDVVTETFRPEARRVTVEMVAISAVMAGAKPEYLPVILATASVFGDVQFESMTRSVNSFGFAQLVNGPIATEIGMTGGLGALGPGNRANASIGRALNLLLRTVGGARLGVNVTPTQGNAMSYALAFAENEAASPWTPFHVDLGYRPDESTVSILLGGWAHNGNFYYGTLDDVAETLMSFEIPQSAAFLLVSEKRAHLMAEAGYTKESIAAELHAKSTIRLGDFRASGFFPMMRGQIEGKGPSTAPAWSAEYLTGADEDIVPAYPPGSIKVLVIGSDVSSTIQAWKLQLHRTVSVDAWR